MGGFLPPAERRSSVLLGLYAALSLLLLVTGERLPQAWLRGVGAGIFAPLDRIVLTADRMGAAWHENQRLHQRIAELELETTRLESARIENERLRQQLGLMTSRRLTLQPVEVLAPSGEPVPAPAALSAGRKQGIEMGDAVVTREGLLGRIAEVYPNLSRVILLTDPNAAIACEIESTGVLGVLHFSGTPHPRLVLTDVALADTVRIGQRVVSSGLSRRYPRFLPVGTVRSLERDPSGLTQTIEVTPAAPLSRLRHAFVVPRPHPLEDAP